MSLRTYFLFCVLFLTGCLGRYAPIPPDIEQQLKSDLEAAEKMIASGDSELLTGAVSLLNRIGQRAPKSELAEKALILLINKGQLVPAARLQEIRRFSEIFPNSRFLSELLTGAVTACVPLVKEMKSFDLCEPVAEKAAERELPERRMQAMANLLVSRIAFQKGELGRARYKIEQAIYLDPNQPLLLIERAKILLAESGGAPNAKKSILAAAEADPSHPDVVSLLGAVSNHITQDEKPSFLFNLGVAQSTSGDLPGARRTLQRLISLFPDSPYSEKAKKVATELDYESHWFTAIEPARRAGFAKNRKLFVLVEAQLCSPCLAIQKNLLSSILVKKTLYDYYIPVRLDAERDPSIIRLLGLSAIPSMVLLEPRTGRTRILPVESVPSEKELDETLREYAQ